MALSGIHWSNEEPLGEIHFLKFLLGRFRALVTMSNLPLEVVERAKSLQPDAMVICRLYRSWGPLPPLSEFVAEWRPSIEALRPFCQRVQVLNEPDLEHGLAAADAVKYFSELRTLLRNEFPWLKLGFPGPAVRPQGPEWIASVAPEARRWDFFAEHCYANDLTATQDPMWMGRHQTVHRYLPDLPIHVTEYGFKTGPGHPTQLSKAEKAELYRRWLEGLPGYVISASVFTSGWAGVGDADGELVVTEEMAHILAGEAESEVGLTDATVLFVEGIDDFKAAHGVMRYLETFIPNVALVWTREAAEQFQRVLIVGNNVSAADEEALRVLGRRVRRVAGGTIGQTADLLYALVQQGQTGFEGE